MSTNDQNVKPEQRRPKDVGAVPEKPEPADTESMAPPVVQPAGVRDKSERPVVNPITGVAS
ncbi:hypothetical protein ELH26_29890 (plasmid) [Rhizobium leguminosarum]|uniref:Uncharacterized protein n=2 Tax=Rhizobium TaxID=379 RepID=A0ABR6A3K1_9HYPH|nr:MULTISPECIES: hypothetical protein [Rhizobium]MBA5801108.1 hypothetical protein [Rhizobium changzhiense]NKL63465.1 hypothetical protein [Rhizobium leguminosarum bv. viciae]TAU45454.1 hypothetical protein ELI43_28285 [Rhizobium leguminosarum]TBC66378.1 hypothetical protein ELH27_27580 [Rhizobium leguminosarum]TBC88486.1 hypothetical protein ELH26_29890 [Rhizobium leguminosarum]